MDRLITELKLPPADAYFKLAHTIEEVNNVVLDASGGDASRRLDPIKGNVAFTAAAYGWSFSLTSFAELYAAVAGVDVDSGALAARLWGDVWYWPEERVFRRRPPSIGGCLGVLGVAGGVGGVGGGVLCA
jgi:U5 small nuclear ribonucleoprotein component